MPDICIAVDLKKQRVFALDASIRLCPRYAVLGHAELRPSLQHLLAPNAIHEGVTSAVVDTIIQRHVDTGTRNPDRLLATDFKQRCFAAGLCSLD
jgi:hypothetical protein